MAYQATQINDQILGDLLLTTFVLIDTENIMPEVRLEKNFKISDNLSARIENQKIIDSLFYENEYLSNL